MSAPGVKKNSTQLSVQTGPWRSTTTDLTYLSSTRKITETHSSSYRSFACTLGR